MKIKVMSKLALPFFFFDLIYPVGGDFMEEVVHLVANVGFPIALSLYLLMRIEAKLELLTTSINQLSLAIQTQERQRDA